MVERSLQASPAGIQAAETALISLGLNQQKLATRLRVTRQPISKFFNGKPVDRNLFVEICKALNLDWQEVAEQPQVNDETDQESDIDALVQAVRDQIKPLIKEQCGTMRVLDMTQPIALTGEQGIYTNVNILEKITGRRRLGLEELLQGCDLEEFDRFGLSRVAEKRVPGLEAVKRHSKLMVLGKPGAGKTTFLKYLAMQCIEGNFQADRIPIFITLNDLVEDDNPSDLFTYINQLMAGDLGIINSYSLLQPDSENTLSVLQKGKLLILLDGLDEVREEHVKKVLQHIRNFSYQFHANQFVITCRIAAQEYNFEHFTEVEIDNFDRDQISIFVRNWFQSKGSPRKAKHFLSQLEDNKPTQELASSPLLLILLCLIFDEKESFPRKRSALYQEGIELLLKEWDKPKKVERNHLNGAYRILSLKQKKKLLSQIAASTFHQQSYFFKPELLEEEIHNFFLPLNKKIPHLDYLDIKNILQSIEAHDGLLIERAKNIYSFSHLTFHEYFTANKIVIDSDYNSLAERITEKRWREVFFLTMGLMAQPKILLDAMTERLNEIANQNSGLERLLTLIHEKSTSLENQYQFHTFCYGKEIKISCELPVIRAFLLGYELEYLQNLEFAYNLSRYTSEYDFAPVQIFAVDYDFDSTVPYRLAVALDEDLGHVPTNHMEYAFSSEPAVKLRQLLDPIRRPFSYFDKPSLKGVSIIESHAIWWEKQQESWARKFNNFMSEHRNAHPDWQLSHKHKQLVKQYYDANKLLVDCLNSDCYVSREVRQEIKDTLLLPIAEIEKYKAANNS